LGEEETAKTCESVAELRKVFPSDPDTIRQDALPGGVRVEENPLVDALLVGEDTRIVSDLMSNLSNETNIFDTRQENNVTTKCDTIS